MPTIWFDMDGTIADLYNVPDWLDFLLEESTKPYEDAKPINFTNDVIDKLHTMGYNIGIISWGSKQSSQRFLKATRNAKVEWLKKHFPSIDGTIHVVMHGKIKSAFKSDGDILIDDEERNRVLWGEGAYSPEEFLKMVA